MSSFLFYQRHPGIHKRAINEPSRLADHMANFPDAFAQSRHGGHSITYKLLITSGGSLARGINYMVARGRKEWPGVPFMLLRGYHGHFDPNDGTNATSPLLVSAPDLSSPPLGSLFASLTFQNEKSPDDARVKKNRRFIISRPSSEN